jgi:hypothetical protein
MEIIKFNQENFNKIVVKSKEALNSNGIIGRLIRSRHPIRRVRYELEEIGKPTIADVLAPIVARGG